MSTTKDEELTIVEMRALREMVESLKKDISTLCDFISTTTLMTSVDQFEKVKTIMDRNYLPKGGSDVAQKNSTT